MKITRADAPPCAWVGLRAPVTGHVSVHDNGRANGSVQWLQHLEVTAMSDALKELEQRAKSLSAEERAKLAEVLLESLEGESLAEIEAAWDREIEERAAAYDRGELQTISAEDVFAEARRLAR
jgi:putative addiction module component (TIGR02574 family)